MAKWAYLLYSEELFYQLILYDFGDFGLMKTAEPVSLRGLMEAAIDFSDVPIEEPVERAEIATHATELLLSKAAMLEDYFSLQLSEVRTASGAEFPNVFLGLISSQ